MNTVNIAMRMPTITWKHVGIFALVLILSLPGMMLLQDTDWPVFYSTWSSIGVALSTVLQTLLLILIVLWWLEAPAGRLVYALVAVALMALVCANMYGMANLA